MKKDKKNSTFAKKIVKWFWALFVVALALITIFFVLIAQGKIGYMPPIEDLENPINKYASQIFSVDLKQMGTYSQQKENRIYTQYNELSPDIVNALVATEDVRYYKHSGIDMYALFRSIIKRGIFNQKNAGGASTIAQQLAKLLYSEHASSTFERLMQKPVEWVIAVQLEKYYTKEEIINLYLNKYDFLYNAVGIQTACWVYFGKSPKDVTTEEAATLIGMCKNASYYNPIRRVELTRQRRNVVLSLMEKNHYISNEECNRLKALPLVTKFNNVDHKDGLAPYFREYLRLTLTAQKPDRKDYADWQKQKYSEDSLSWINNPLYGWCNKHKKANGSYYNLHTDGLKIYTTIDSRMQVYAEEAVTEHMGGYLQNAFFKEKANSKIAPFSRDLKPKEIEEIMNRAVKQTDRYRNLKKDKKSDAEITAIFNTPVEMTIFSWKGLKDTVMTPLDSVRYMKSFLRTGFMAMDVHTGAVKAYVGGIDYHYFQYDMVNLGRRQIGSTVKPYLYSLAMESGLTPCNEVLHVQPELIKENGEPWYPRNANKNRIGEMVSIQWGLQNSDNWVTASLMKQLSPYTFARLLHSYGLQGNIEPVLSLCLGPCDISVSEMVSGYSTFVNGGIRVEPIYVTRIEDMNGNIIDTFSSKTHEVISQSASYKTLSMMRSVVDGGTGNRIRRNHGMTVQMGGKTGTTQNNSDGWFMCFSPSIVGGCWVGGEERSIRFDRMSEGQGASMALPIVGKFFNKVYNDSRLGYSQSETFTIPAAYSNPCENTSSSTIVDVNASQGELDDIFN